MSELPFQITKEEVLELAANKVAGVYSDDGDLLDKAESIIREKIEAMVQNTLMAKVDKFLTDEMEKLITQKISPVDIWGDKTGTPTTIRDALAERARIFWEMNVDEQGRHSTYGGSPRHEVLFKRIVKEQFEEAVKANVGEITKAFKAALKVDAAKITAEHIDRLIH